MMIMQEPDKKKKKNTENGFPSLFCIFQTQRTEKKKQKNGYFYSGKRAGWLFAVSGAAQRFVLLRGPASGQRGGGARRCSCPASWPKRLARDAGRSWHPSSRLGDRSGLLTCRGVLWGIARVLLWETARVFGRPCFGKAFCGGGGEFSPLGAW